METKTVNGVEFVAPGLAQCCDKGNPKASMDAAEQYLRDAKWKLRDAAGKRDKEAVNLVYDATVPRLIWFRHQGSCMGEISTWDDPTVARFRAMREWLEMFYSSCSREYRECVNRQ